MLLPPPPTTFQTRRLQDSAASSQKRRTRTFWCSASQDVFVVRPSVKSDCPSMCTSTPGIARRVVHRASLVTMAKTHALRASWTAISCCRSCRSRGDGNIAALRPSSIVRRYCDTRRQLEHVRSACVLSESASSVEVWRRCLKSCGANIRRRCCSSSTTVAVHTSQALEPFGAVYSAVEPGSAGYRRCRAHAVVVVPRPSDDANLVS
jgi:hypothetical protein